MVLLPPLRGEFSNTDAQNPDRYNEAQPLMLSTPLFTIDQCPRILSAENARLLNFRNIRNLHLKECFDDFPQLAHPAQVSWAWTDWLIICRTLISMTKLRYLCFSITIVNKALHHLSSENYDKLVDEFLKPLKAVKIPAGVDGQAGRGQFDLVTRGWRVTHELSGDVPFRVFFDERPAIE